MCNCGCNTCETKGPLLTEGKVKSLLSEGLQYHIDKQVPLFETVYRIGSDKHLALIKEARKMYSRNVIDLCEDDEALIKTHLGEFALYEGESVPLDLPMLNEYQGDGTNKISSDKLTRLVQKMPKGYVGKNTGIGEYTISTPDGEDIVLTQSKDKKNWSYEPSNVALKILNESYDYDEVAQSEFGMDYDQLGSGEKEWVRDEIDNMSMNEANSNYPDFDLNKNIKYQDTSISSGMWRYTGQEQGGKGVYRNLNNGQILAFDRSDFDIFRNNLSSHFDISEGQLNEGKAIITFKNDYEVKMNTGEGYDDDFEYFEAGEREQVYILDKNDKRVHVEFGDGTNAYIPTSLISVQEKSLNEERKYNQEELARLDLIAHRRFGCDYEKCTDEQKAEVLKDKVKVGVKEALQEAKKKKKKEKKDPPLNKPKRGGSKAYYVYVRDPKTKKIKKVSFGSGGLRAKIKNKEARNAFAKRHRCKDKKDRTKAGYWSCNLPRYASALGLGANMNTFW